MSDDAPGGSDVPLSALPPEEKARRAGSFGTAAAHYDRYRPGPSPAAVEWILGAAPGGRVVDLGAGTGALSRILVDRAAQVVAVEPDAQMRAVLGAEVPAVTALEGRAESIPLPDASVDAVVASSSWHWADPGRALPEVGRVLVGGGVLGTLWSGPDPDGALVAQARALLGGPGGSGAAVLGDAGRPNPTLEIPDGTGFCAPEHEAFTWDVAMTADQLVGLLGTFSAILLMEDDERRRLLDEARRLLDDVLGISGDTTIDLAFRADAWRATWGG